MKAFVVTWLAFLVAWWVGYFAGWRSRRRFALFAYRDHEAGGGWNDHVASFRSADEAAAAGDADPYDHRKGEGFDWWHVVDLRTGEIVRTGPELEFTDEDTIR